MARCAWCEQIKPVDAFDKVYAGMLREVCRECEKQPLTYCGFCGLPVHDGKFYKISDGCMSAWTAMSRRWPPSGRTS